MSRSSRGNPARATSGTRKVPDIDTNTSTRKQSPELDGAPHGTQRVLLTLPAESLISGNAAATGNVTILDNIAQHLSTTKPGHQKDHRSADEKRLLGDYAVDDDAVPISIPRNSFTLEKMPTVRKVADFGVQPVSTLVTPKKRPHESEGSTRADVWDLHGTSHRRAKRTRRDRPISPSSPYPDDSMAGRDPESSILVDDSPTSPEIARPRTSQLSLASSQESGKSKRDKAANVKEFYGVEDRMNPKTRRRSTRPSALHDHPSSDQLPTNGEAGLRTHGAKPGASPETGILLDATDQQPAKSRYGGTANLRPSKKPGKQRSVSRPSLPGPQVGPPTASSRFFPPSKSETMRNNGHMYPPTSRPASSAGTFGLEMAASLAESTFRPTFPKTSPDDLYHLGSPDPIQDPIDLDWSPVRDGPPHDARGDKRSGTLISRSPSPVKAAGDERLTRANADITPTKFTTSGGTDLSSTMGSKTSQPRRSLNRVFPLKRIRSGIIDVSDEHSLELYFNEAIAGFEVHLRGRVISEERQVLALRPTAVNRVVHDNTSPMVQIIRHRERTFDTRIDYYFRDGQVAQEFRALLAEFGSTIADACEERGRLEKIFKKREDEMHLQKEPAARVPVDDVTGQQEVRFIQQKRAKEKARQREAEGSARHLIHKRLRVDPSPVPSKAQRDESSYLQHTQPQSTLHPETPLRIVAGIVAYAATPTTRSRSRGKAVDVEELHKRSPSPTRVEFEKQPSKQKLEAAWEESLVFPIEGTRKTQTTVDYGDLERLKDGEFLNDNLISFYLRYLEFEREKSRPSIAPKVYIFNTFFYERLTTTAKGRRGINYEAVEKWTSKIDIFQYDFVVVPINESAHWYVAVICNLPTLVGDLSKDGPGALPDVNGMALQKDAGAHDVERDRLSEDVELDSTQEGVSLMSLTREGPARGFRDQRESVARPGGPGKVEDLSLMGPLTDGRAVRPADTFSLTSIDLFGAEDTERKRRASPRPGPPELSPHSKRRGKRKSMPPTKKYQPFEPAIITLDSLGQAHGPTVRNLKEYLREEAKMKRHVSFEIGDISGVTAKQIPLQDNFCDCGLFLLGYMEKFLKSPRALVTKLLQRDLDPDRDWPDVNPGKMRKMLKETLEGLWQAQKRRRTNDTNDAAALKALKKRGSQQVMKDTTLALAPARSDLMEGRSPTDDIQPDDQGRESTARAERIEMDLPSTKLMKALYDAAGAADDDLSNSLLITGSAPVEKEDQTRLKGEGSKGEGPRGGA